MAITYRRGSRFPISPDLIGPWDRLVKEDSSLGLAVQSAKQQVVNLNQILELLMEGGQALQLIADLTARVEALESGSSPGGLIAFQETPLGTMDGSNPQFTLTVTPTLLFLVLNGQLLIPGGEDYTLSGSIIIYVTGKIPESTDVHYALGLV